MPSRPFMRSAGARSMIKAEQLQITMVSMITPKAWIHIGCGRGTGSRSGAGFIGEKAALDSVHENSAEAAGSHLAETEGLGKNMMEDRRKLSDVFKNNKQGDEKVAASHNGDHNIQDLDRGIFSQYDHSRQKHQKDGGIKRRDVEGVGKCRGYRVADHLADAAPADQAGNGKQDGDQGVTGLCLAFAGEKVMDIIGRTAPVAAV